jgi:hypothetical protein
MADEKGISIWLTLNQLSGLFEKHTSELVFLYRSGREGRQNFSTFHISFIYLYVFIVLVEYFRFPLHSVV